MDARSLLVAMVGFSHDGFANGELDAALLRGSRGGLALSRSGARWGT